MFQMCHSITPPCKSVNLIFKPLTLTSRSNLKEAWLCLLLEARFGMQVIQDLVELWMKLVFIWLYTQHTLELSITLLLIQKLNNLATHQDQLMHLILLKTLQPELKTNHLMSGKIFLKA